MEPGGIQHIHSHEPEQMYYILEGNIKRLESEGKLIEKEEDRVNEILKLQKKNKKYYKPKTTKEQIEREKIYYDYDKVEQQKILIKHGMKYETIKKYYKTEEARVNAIMNLEKKSGKKYKP